MELTIYFIGLCTHLRQSNSGVTEHRVVLINAGHRRLVNGHRIRRHTAQLVRQGHQPVPLNGVFIRANAATPKLRYDNWECIPRLRDHASGELPKLSPYMIAGEDPDLVSAYFDASGSFSALLNNNHAAIAVLKVPTVGDPEISLDPFGPDEAPRTIRLQDNDTICIENVDLGPMRHTGEDFLLHYKMFMRVPPDADWPRDIPDRCKPHSDGLPCNGNTVGPGCSNSTYP